MTLPVYHEDLCELFERADSPFIFSRRCKPQLRLSQLPPSPQNLQESVEAVRGVMEAVLFLRMNMITPCQLRFEYIVKCDGKWGLCHAICDRSDEEGKDSNIDTYNPEEYIFHLDSENELVWNIGKVWLRFFTSQPVKIKHNTQNKMDRLIDAVVPKPPIAALMKRLLCLNKNERVKFEELLQVEELSGGQQEQTKFYSSLMVHLKNVSGILGSRGGMSKFSQKNPFLRELNYRRFLEYLDVDGFLENVKSDLRKEYMIEDEGQKFICEFTLYMISMKSYKNMVVLNTERLEQGERFEEINDRIYYARFTKRMLTLRELIQRKARLLAKSPQARKSLQRFFEDPDKIDEELVYSQFKICLSEYAEFLIEDLKVNKQDKGAKKLLAKIFIARTCGYIFNQYRNEVFEPLFRNEKSFSVRKIYSKINDCDSIDVLEALIVNIQNFYFKN